MDKDKLYKIGDRKLTFKELVQYARREIAMTEEQLAERKEREKNEREQLGFDFTD